MSPVHVEVARDVGAPAAHVYRVLADYRAHHPRIVPKPEFEAVVVERGGVGAGTVVRVEMKVMGKRATLRLTVTEPEPGRVLAETDEKGNVTTFTVEPRGAARCSVRIATTWRAEGLGGRVEAWVHRRVARGLYERELAQLERYVASLAPAAS